MGRVVVEISKAGVIRSAGRRVGRGLFRAGAVGTAAAAPVVGGYGSLIGLNAARGAAARRAGKEFAPKVGLEDYAAVLYGAGAGGAVSARALRAAARGRTAGSERRIAAREAKKQAAKNRQKSMPRIVSAESGPVPPGKLPDTKVYGVKPSAKQREEAARRSRSLSGRARELSGRAQESWRSASTGKKVAVIAAPSSAAAGGGTLIMSRRRKD